LFVGDVGDTSNWQSTTYVFRYSKLSNYFFTLIRNCYIMDQGYFDMFMVLEECRKNYRQVANTYVILIVKENRMCHLNGYRNVLLVL